MAVGEGAVWVAGAETVVRIDPRTNQVIAKIPYGGSSLEVPLALAVGEGAVWVVHGGEAGTLSRIDPQTNRVVAMISVGGYPSLTYSRRHHDVSRTPCRARGAHSMTSDMETRPR